MPSRRGKAWIGAGSTRCVPQPCGGGRPHGSSNRGCFRASGTLQGVWCGRWQVPKLRQGCGPPPLIRGGRDRLYIPHTLIGVPSNSALLRNTFSFHGFSPRSKITRRKSRSASGLGLPTVAQCRCGPHSSSVDRRAVSRGRRADSHPRPGHHDRQQRKRWVVSQTPSSGPASARRCFRTEHPTQNLASLNYARHSVKCDIVPSKSSLQVSREAG